MDDSIDGINISDIDWQEINNKLPVHKSDEDKEKRKNLFNSFDSNGNGYLSLAEIDLGFL